MAKRSRSVAPPYRSKFEAIVAEDIKKNGLPLLYENVVLKYDVPARVGSYHPDFQIGPKTFIESKGKWVVEDRKKHLLLKEQYEPQGYKIYLVFYNANQRLSKKSKTTYGMWATKHGIEWSHRVIKKEWLDGLDQNENLRNGEARGRKRKGSKRT